MKRMVSLCALLLFAAGVCAQDKEIGSEKLVNWIRAVITMQVKFKIANHKSREWRGIAGIREDGQAYLCAVLLPMTYLRPLWLPISLQITTSTDDASLSRRILQLSDILDKATWCKIAGFSKYSGLIYLGQNIGCSGVANLGASSKPSS